MLGEDEPRFANWDQDATAVATRYAEQDPAAVGAELVAAAEPWRRLYAGVAATQWQRRGTGATAARVHRRDASARYHLHDVVHHLHDVGRDPRSTTVAAYDAQRRRVRATPAPRCRDAVRARSSTGSPRRCGAGARVLEIGSGPGRDALALEARRAAGSAVPT